MPEWSIGVHSTQAPLAGPRDMMAGTKKERRDWLLQQGFDAASAGRPMPPEKVEEIKAAAVAGVLFQQMCNGIPAGGGKRDRSLIVTTSKKLQRQRKLDPEFDAFVSKHFEANNFIGQLLRHNKDASEEMKTTLRLIGKIRHKVKASGAELPRLHEQKRSRSGRR